MPQTPITSRWPCRLLTASGIPKGVAQCPTSHDRDGKIEAMSTGSWICGRIRRSQGPRPRRQDRSTVHGILALRAQQMTLSGFAGAMRKPHDSDGIIETTAIGSRICGRIRRVMHDRGGKIEATAIGSRICGRIRRSQGPRPRRQDRSTVHGILALRAQQMTLSGFAGAMRKPHDSDGIIETTAIGSRICGRIRRSKGPAARSKQCPLDPAFAGAADKSRTQTAMATRSRNCGQQQQMGNAQGPRRRRHNRIQGHRVPDLRAHQTCNARPRRQDRSNSHGVPDLRMQQTCDGLQCPVRSRAIAQTSFRVSVKKTLSGFFFFVNRSGGSRGRMPAASFARASAGK
jgi:hypothetical protein